MKIVFSNHALLQIAERNISKAEVERTVIKPQKMVQQTPTRYRAVRSIKLKEKRYLMVVIYDNIGSGEDKEVVTSFLTTKFKKYL